MAALEVVQVRALSDNYIYLLHDASNGATAVVDPAEAGPVLDELERRNWTLTHILNTHHHDDHIGGNGELRAKYDIEHVGFSGDAHRIPNMHVQVKDGDTYDFAGHVAQVFETPGHTSGHIAFWFEADGALFCGDTLFALGCGRLFEGTAEEMWASLSKLKVLPPETQVYCAHEYTQSNARFALSVDGTNAALQARSDEIDRARAADKPTVPSSLAIELATNPFLRADDATLAANVGLAGADPIAVFTEVRTRKDNF